MFKTLFKYPRVLARHREGPVADARERFLIHCAEQGLARESLLRTAREVLIIAKHIDLTTGKTISIHDVEAAADRWGVHQQRRHRLRGFALDGSRQLFIQKALPWLRFLDRLEEPDNETIPFAGLLEDFAVYMRDQRGLSTVTIRNRCRFADQRGARAHTGRCKSFGWYPSHSGEQILQDTTRATQP